MSFGKFLTISIVVLAIIIGAVGLWYYNRNIYSKEILKLEVLGPEEAAISQEVEYTVRYKNNGNVRLEEPRLIFEFPEYTVLSEELSRRKEIGPEELGDIYPGEEKAFKFKGRLFGKEGEVKTAKVWLSYRPKNLKARYESSTTFSTTVKSIPLTFEFDLFSKVEAGRIFKFSLNYFSNLNYLLTDLRVKMEYPSDFEFLESNPKSLEKTEWEIPLLNPAEGGRIEVRGKLSGEVKERKIFKAILGLWQKDEFIPLKEITRGVEITKPNLFVFQRINGQDQYIANLKDLLHYEIFFRNIGEEPFIDLFLVARLDGAVFDFDSLKINSGQFNKSDNSMVWDWRDTAKLRFLSQGEEGKVEFWINLKEDLEIKSPQDKNFTLKNSVLISNLKEEFETKVNSKLVIFQKGYYQDEVFGNSGPLPPKVGESTTYTIIWRAKNYYNDVRNVKVKAVLPPEAKLTGKIFPEEEKSKFAFDSQSREIIWMVKDEMLSAGTGILDSAPNIAFQVSLSPNPEQRGRVATLINEAEITGEDTWTEAILENKAEAIDTTLAEGEGLGLQMGTTQ